MRHDRLKAGLQTLLPKRKSGPKPTG